ncbi:MAG: sigma-70 family RNA polymerase sigma factor [Planctomycetota bacterium]
MAEKSIGTATRALSEFKAGDDEAFEHLVELYESKVQNFARKKLARTSISHKDEFDATQSALFSFVSSFQSGNFPGVVDSSSFEAMVTAILRNKIRDYIKQELTQKRGAGKNVHASKVEMDAEDLRHGESVYKSAMNELLDLLTDPTTRQVARLSMEGFSREETATETGLSLRTVFRHLKTAQSEMSKFLHG